MNKTKAKASKSMMEPKTKPPKAPKSKAVGPYVEPGPVRSDQIGVTSDRGVDAILKKAASVSKARKGKVRPNPELTKAIASVDRIKDKRLAANKVKVFDLMADFSAMSDISLYGARAKCNFVAEWKDHTDIIAERPGAPGARFEWLLPGGERGEQVLTTLSEAWEFDAVREGLLAIQSHIRNMIETERKRNDVLRRLTPEERELIGKGEWRDTENDND